MSVGIGRDYSSPGTFVDGSATVPLSAKNLNAMVQGIVSAHAKAELLAGGGFYLDSYAGTDDQRLTAAIAAQRSYAGTRNMPPIILPSRQLLFTSPRKLYSGLKIVGVHRGGQSNMELVSGNYVGSEILLGGSIGSGPTSWWNDQGVADSIFNVYMADFTVQGSSKGSHQFLDNPTRTLYASEFSSLSFVYMRGVFGNSTRKSLHTQVCLSGSWTFQNLFGTQMFVGGSDNIYFMDSFCNIGTGGAAAFTAVGSNQWYIKFDSIESTIGKIYVSTLNGWRGVLISGSGTSIDMHGGVYEGYKPARQNGLLSGPGPGAQIKITGGAVSMDGVKVGQGMDNRAAGERGLVQVDGGEVTMHGCTFYGRNMGTVAAVDHNGGRLTMLGTMRRQNEGAYWTGRPRVETRQTNNKGASSFYCPDNSVQIIAV